MGGTHQTGGVVLRHGQRFRAQGGKIAADLSALGQGDRAGVLEFLGEAAKDAVPALIQALRDEDGQVRHFATEALKQIGTSEATEAGTQ